MPKRVLVAMSGGVDSSVACLLLKGAGFEVAGVTMCLGEKGGEARCCGVHAVEDAASVCLKLGIPHFVLDFSQEMENVVIANFVEEYRRGRTPNPCVLCNRHLKFGKLLTHALSAGFDFLATGHYAILEGTGDKYRMRRPKDRAKDQTYFLWAIPQEVLPRLLFPLGEYTKEEVRRMAKEAGLLVAEKPQSQDLCFVPGGKYQEFLEKHLGEGRSGNIVNGRGRVLGRHQGVFRYTVGQRRGLGISSSHPLYVVAIRPESNEVVVGEREALLSRGLRARYTNWFSEEVPHRALAQVRYRHRPRPCRVKVEGEGTVEVLFEEPVEMVTPGQSVVFYQGDVLLGGGIIEEAIRDGRKEENRGAQEKEERCHPCPQL